MPSSRNASSSRREFLRRAGLFAASSAAVSLTSCRTSARRSVDAGRATNVLIIITDDQGYGDLGCHGNELISTPNLDRLHANSARFGHFHVSPVCSPTRACLMTGRYNYRTGVVDTYIGRSMMHPDETTIAEILSRHGYRTGIFGKWHLGDNYPMRAMDQGFQESLVHLGGGIAQPSDPPGNAYFDPILKHNGVRKTYQGYCTDIFTDAAMSFIETNRHRPFFAYLATNAPHSPFQIGDDYSAPYFAAGLDEQTAKVYGMITNIDDNLGRLLDHLRALGLEDNTLVIFLTDNGPARIRGQERFNAGLRDFKGSAYEGGIRVPCFLRWPAAIPPGRDILPIAAHIDILPTVLEACRVPIPRDLHLDGVSLMPLLLEQDGPWPDRTLYLQWHRGDEPEPFRNSAARSQRFKLVNGTELYDVDRDPGELHDLAGDRPDVVERMRADYEAWFQDVSATRGYAPPRIFLGTPHENPTTLTRQDWRGSQGWGDKHIGYWEVDVRRRGRYDVTLRWSPGVVPEQVGFSLDRATRSAQPQPGAASHTFENVFLDRGEGRLEAWLSVQGERVGVRYVDVLRR